MADIICNGFIDRGSEFFRTIPNGPESSRIYAACGGRALTSVAEAALNKHIGAVDVYWALRNHQLCDPDGASTLETLHSGCDLFGLTHVAWHDYDEHWATWRADVVLQAKARNPFVLMLHAGQQLTDMISGLGENGSGIQNHFIAVLAYHPGGASNLAGGRVLPEGLWCADGANFAGGNDRAHNFNAANVLQFYSLDNLQQAWPCGFVVVRGYQEAQQMAWQQTSNGAKDDQGHVVGLGIAAAIFAANLAQHDGLMSETYYNATQSFAPLTNGMVVSWDGKAAHVDQAAQVLVAVWEELVALKNAPKPTPTPPAPEPPVTPTPAPDPRTKAALSLLDAMEAALAAK